MPNLLPDWLPWIQPAGRLIWSTLMLVVGVLFVLVLMKPPMLKRPFPNGIGYALWQFDGDFGVLNSGRADVAYEDWHGQKLDRKLLELLKKC